MSVAPETAPAGDMVLTEAVTQPAMHSALAARIDVSGLLAIAASAPQPAAHTRGDGAIPPADWHAHGERGDEESLLTRYSA